MEWIPLSKTSPELNRPVQGLKVLCFNKGDCYVAQRFNYKGKDHWISLSFATEDFSTDAPEMFAYISFPDGYRGMMRVKNPNNDVLITFDELQKSFPKEHEEVVEHIISSVMFKKYKSKKFNDLPGYIDGIRYS